MPFLITAPGVLATAATLVIAWPPVAYLVWLQGVPGHAMAIANKTNADVSAFR